MKISKQKEILNDKQSHDTILKIHKYKQNSND